MGDLRYYTTRHRNDSAASRGSCERDGGLRSPAHAHAAPGLTLATGSPSNPPLLESPRGATSARLS
jgi:hypothetical protein